MALEQLTKLYFPKEYGEPVCVVRPQWTYNLKCVPLKPYLETIIPRWDIDPNKTLGKKIKSTKDIISKLWEKRLKRINENLIRDGKKPINTKLPAQIGVLSFAGLDTPDAFFLPLLGHELGHFIDFSGATPLHANSELKDSSDITKDQVRDTMERVTGKWPDPGEVGRYWGLLREQKDTCLRELLADRLATRMLGFSFFVAQTRFLKSLTAWYQPKILESGYPGIKFRLSEILKHLTSDYRGNPLTFLKPFSKTSIVAERLIKYIETWQEHLDSLVPFTQQSKLFSETFAEPFAKLVEDAITPEALEILSRIAQEAIPDELCAHLDNDFFKRIAQLELDLPPSMPQEGTDSFAAIMSAAWAYQIVYGEERDNKEAKVNESFDEYSKTCRLILKAIELIPVYQSIYTESKKPQDEDIPNDEEFLNKRGTLSNTEIRRRVLLPITNPSRITISPLRIDAINGASLDVHLGNWFAYARRTRLRGLKISDKEEMELLRSIGRSEAFIPSDKTFLLHPGDLALGITQEFIALPQDVMAFVEGRSGLGRLGLFVATATQVAPGFHGVIVLELANAGTVPLELQPGFAIAQLIFQVMTDPVPENMLYRGKYYCQIKPL
ncbi:MAG TPA: dCTP deaminase [Pyrinomonadaceae bacterium]